MKLTVGALFVPSLAKKIGKRNVLMYSLALQGLCLLGLYFTPFDNLTMVIVITVIFGLLNIGFPMTLSMVADSVDYMELKSGVRTDGTAYATYGLATKLGNALGAAVGVMLLAAFGYVAGAEQTERALHGINIVVNMLPGILFLGAAACCLLWNISDEEADDMRRQLKERHEVADQSISGHSCKGIGQLP